MNRFFVPLEQIKDEKIVIKGEDVNHIKYVLRFKINDKIEVVCNGVVYLSTISFIKNNEIVVDILETKVGDNEPPIDIYLYQGLPKSSKMDFIIQKATEIGVKKIFPIITKRTVVKIKNSKKEENKVNRWNKICTEAAKQSKRDNIPKVNNILKFNEMIELLREEENILVPYESEENNGLKNILNKSRSKKIHLIIGPEGGFEAEEIMKLKSVDGKIVSLGPRILRTETAGLATMAILMYELGDMGVIR